MVKGLWLLLLIVELKWILVSGSTQAVIYLPLNLIGQLSLTLLIQVLANILWLSQLLSINNVLLVWATNTCMIILHCLSIVDIIGKVFCWLSIQVMVSWDYHILSTSSDKDLRWDAWVELPTIFLHFVSGWSIALLKHSSAVGLILLLLLRVQGHGILSNSAVTHSSAEPWQLALPTICLRLLSLWVHPSFVGIFGHGSLIKNTWDSLVLIWCCMLVLWIYQIAFSTHTSWLLVFCRDVILVDQAFCLG